MIKKILFTGTKKYRGSLVELVRMKQGTQKREVGNIRKGGLKKGKKGRMSLKYGPKKNRQ